MIAITYDHGGAVNGVVINETTYSPAALSTLVTEVARLRAVEVAAVRAEGLAAAQIDDLTAELGKLRNYNISAIHGRQIFRSALRACRAECKALRAVADAAIALRHLESAGSAATSEAVQARLSAWLAAEHELYAAVDALLVAQEGDQG